MKIQCPSYVLEEKKSRDWYSGKILPSEIDDTRNHLTTFIAR